MQDLFPFHRRTMLERGSTGESTPPHLRDEVFLQVREFLLSYVVAIARLPIYFAPMGEREMSNRMESERR